MVSIEGPVQLSLHNGRNGGVMDEKKKKSSALDTLFPEKEVALSDKVSVTMRPLSLKDLPKVTEAFGKIMSLAEEGMATSEIATAALSELLQLIPFCIVEDLSPEEIPATAAPFLAEVFLSQNVTDEVVGKWVALAEKIAVLQEAGQGGKKKQRTS